MFERFTEKAIKVVMLSQEESRRLGHNFVGTEQILLGLIGEGTGVAYKVLRSVNLTLKDARMEVERIIGRGSGFVAVEIPFTPRAKRVLENSIDIGPNSTVRRASLDSTIIKSGTKIGSLVNIGHNSIIGKNCILTSNIITGGSSEIGDYTFIGVNSVIKNGIKVGKNSIIGMGSVVTKELKSNIVAFGSPAKEIRKNI